ncbi:hypothetical protein Tco_0911024 [Tanacetum coccineum]|uniref:Uncharacterized protein n=1 Tax=Tanacetum coccineum TaxID=301880 RepID=A0ABQ5D0U0_9ASTR
MGVEKNTLEFLRALAEYQNSDRVKKSNLIVGFKMMSSRLNLFCRSKRNRAFLDESTEPSVSSVCTEGSGFESMFNIPISTINLLKVGSFRGLYKTGLFEISIALVLSQNMGTTMSREELELTKVYIPKISREKHIPVHLKSIIHDLENRSIHEGYYPRFLLELFSSAEILRDEERGDYVYSNEYSLESLNKNPEEVYPYQTNIPTPDEIISDITINGVTEDPLKIRKNELRRDFRFWNEVIESNGIGEETYSQYVLASSCHMICCILNR